MRSLLSSITPELVRKALFKTSLQNKVAVVLLAQKQLFEELVSPAVLCDHLPQMRVVVLQ